MLSWNDKLTIEKLFKAKVPVKEIARIVGVSHQTIYNERQRGKVIVLNTDLEPVEVYAPEMSRVRHNRARQNMGKQLGIGSDHKTAQYIVEKLKAGWSPAAISSTLREAGMTYLSKNTIYSYIDKGYLWPITNADLRFGRRKRPYHRVDAARPSKGTSIERRPAFINERVEFGHWEMDSVMGKKGSSSCLIALTERKSLREIVLKVSDHTSRSTVAALDLLERRMGREFFRRTFKSITVDNGCEFMDTYGMEHSADGTERTKVYYCHPMFPGERGRNEKQNAMVRWFFPKGTDFGSVSQAEIDEIVSWMNNYPRASLGWKTPAQLYL